MNPSKSNQHDSPFNRSNTRTLFAHLIVLDFALVLLDFIIVHVSERILSVVRFVNDGIVLLITLDYAFRSSAHYDDGFGR